MSPVKSFGLDTKFSYVCTVTLTLEIWPESRKWHTLRSWTTNVWRIIQIQVTSESYGLDTKFSYKCTVTLTSVHSHDTSLGHGQQLCEVSSPSKLAVRSYGSDMNFYKELWPWPRKFDLGSQLWHTLGEQLCEILPRSDKGVRSLCAFSINMYNVPSQFQAITKTCIIYAKTQEMKRILFLISYQSTLSQYM